MTLKCEMSTTERQTEMRDSYGRTVAAFGGGGGGGTFFGGKI